MEEENPLTASAEAEGRRLLMTAFETAPAGNFTARADLVGRLRRDSRRSRRVRTLVPAGAAAAVAGAAAVGVTLTASVASAPSAMAAVTAAAAKSSAESFRVTTVTTIKSPAGPLREVRKLAVGVFDPTRALGEEHLASSAPGGGGFEIRLVGEHIYARPGGAPFWFADGKPWVEGRIGSLPASRAGARAARIASGFNGDVPLDPAQLLGSLESAVSVTNEGQASGPGWTGTKYGFTVQLPKEPGMTLHGTVWVDEQGRVRRVLVTSTSTLKGMLTVTRDVTFSGFGVPVSVTAPPAGQVYNLGDSPLVFGF